MAGAPADVDHPDELRVDLDPGPEIPFDQVREVALVTREVLDEHGLAGFPKTSGKKGIHVNVRIRPAWSFTEVRRAALALAREVERRVPDLATTKWWKEERHGVFIDYNQNARDRTVASAYSVRPCPTRACPRRSPGTRSRPWSPRPSRCARSRRGSEQPGDPGAAIDERAAALEPLLTLSDRQAAEGRTTHRSRRTSRRPRASRRAQPSGGAARGPTRRDGAATGAGEEERTDRAAPHHDAADRDRARGNDAEAREGLERWKARHPEAAGPSSRPTSWSIRCAGGAPPGRGSG